MNMLSWKESIDAIVKTYGPFAFSLISLLVIWLAIIAPELDRKQMDFEAHRALMLQLQDRINQSDEMARNIKDAAIILDRVTERTNAR